ncbi:MAG: Gluconate 5-dehydrogenase [Phycisphaerae bacterium]|nr:Gluconate 5-dehydrogenase [Phycisphaerae bacterium]
MTVANPFSLVGRRALVTGASRGIGRAIAEQLARAGAAVALVARSREPLAEVAAAITAGGGRSAVCPADLADPASAEAAVAQAEIAIGPVDLLVHAAGTTARVPSIDAPAADFDRIMQVNAGAAMQLAQAVGRRLLAAGRGGAMVFVASLQSRGARPTTLHYTMSKTAMLGLIRSLAVEWGPRGIRCNGVAPGYIRTELTRPLQEDAKFSDWVLSRTPAGRWGEPGDLAAAAQFLLSDAASFVNGQVLYVDGGWSAAM